MGEHRKHIIYQNSRLKFILDRDKIVWNVFTEENFLLILKTEFQATLFQKFSTFVCVDSTHKTNEYGYKLISMVIVDEFRNGKYLCTVVTSNSPCVQ